MIKKEKTAALSLAQNYKRQARDQATLREELTQVMGAVLVKEAYVAPRMG